MTCLFGRFALIFYFNCDYVLFVYIVKQKQTKKLGPIGSAVLTFVGHKQTDKQTQRQAKYICRFDKDIDKIAVARNHE